MAGALPGGQFIRLRGVFIVHDGVQRVDCFHTLLDERADDGSVADAIFAVAFHVRIGIRDGLAVGLQIGHETGGHFMRHKLGHQRGLGRLDGGAIRGLRRQLKQERICRGEQRGGIVSLGRMELVRKARLILVNRRCGARDVLDVQPDGIEQRLLAGIGVAHLTRLGLIQAGDDLVNGGKVGFGYAAGGKIRPVVVPERLDAIEHIITTFIPVIHGDPLV